MSTSEMIIECRDVSFAYGQYVAIRHLDMAIKKGECVVLAGPNGCGKSTVLKLLNGLIFPQKGEFLFMGEPVTEKSLKDQLFAKSYHQRIGFVFQNADIQLFCASVEEEIMFGPLQMGLSEADALKRCEDLLKMLKIEHLRERAPYHLSGGEKRKVSLACILSMNPEVLILDEPLTGLDAKSQEWLISFLKAYKAAGKTMVISTHSTSLAETLADYIIEMNETHGVEQIRRCISD